MKTFELINCNHKAIVNESAPDTAELLSYGTKVAVLDHGKMRRIDGQPQSNTTAKHMREFAMLYGFPYMTKAELKKLPVTEV